MVSVLVARACRWITLSQGLKEASDPSRLGANFHLVVVCLGELESRSPLDRNRDSRPAQLQIMDGTNLQGSSLDQKKPPVRVRLVCRPMLRRNNFTSETELLVKTKQS